MEQFIDVEAYQRAKEAYEAERLRLARKKRERQIAEIEQEKMRELAEVMEHRLAQQEE